MQGMEAIGSGVPGHPWFSGESETGLHETKTKTKSTNTKKLHVDTYDDMHLKNLY